VTLEACARLVERGDPDRFRVAMAAPPPAREALFPLYAFNLEVARAPYVTKEPLLAEMRIQWWREALAEAAAGAPPRAHEVAGPLGRLILDRGLDVAPLDALAEARRREVETRPLGAEEVRDYVRATGGGLMRASCAALGEDRPEAEEAGFAGGLAAWLLALPDLAARGRGLQDPAPRTVRALADEGLAALAAARRHPFGPAVPALRAAFLAPSVLSRASREPQAALDGRLAPSEGAKRARLLWLTLRGTW
jgi:phytoene/squalene synthetase